MNYITKDSGQREEYDSGMRRDVQAGKARYDLIYKPLHDMIDDFVQADAYKHDHNQQAIDAFEFWLASGDSYLDLVERMLAKESFDTGGGWKYTWYAIRKRWAELMARGAEKYGEDNWMKANSVEELNRFKNSASRHFYQWILGEDDEDHFAAVLFNIACVQYVSERLEEEVDEDYADFVDSDFVDSGMDQPEDLVVHEAPEDRPYGVWFGVGTDDERLTRTFSRMGLALEYARQMAKHGGGYAAYRVAPTKLGSGTLDGTELPLAFPNEDDAEADGEVGSGGIADVVDAAVPVAEDLPDVAGG